MKAEKPQILVHATDIKHGIGHKANGFRWNDMLQYCYRKDEKQDTKSLARGLAKDQRARSSELIKNDAHLLAQGVQFSLGRGAFAAQSLHSCCQLALQHCILSGQTIAQAAVVLLHCSSLPSPASTKLCNGKL